MSEIISSNDYETKLRHKLCLMLVKPDAVEAGIAEELIDHTCHKLKAAIPDIRLLGAVFILSFNDDEIERIYPDLQGDYKQALKDFYKQGPSIAVFWGSESGSQDLWSELIKIRGKITLGYGLKDSIRSIVPLPGYKERYDATTKKLQAGNLDSDDYVELCRSLVHIPQNLKEFEGLFFSIDKEDIDEIFSEPQFNNFRNEFANQLHLFLT